MSKMVDDDRWVENEVVYRPANQKIVYLCDQFEFVEKSTGPKSLDILKRVT
jgi:hypothetical protein